MGRSWRLAQAIGVVALYAGVVWASEGAYEIPDGAVYHVVDAEVAPGQEGVRVPVEARFPEATQGFSMALRFESAVCTIQEGKLLTAGALADGADYVSLLVDDPMHPEPGTAVIGLLMDMAPPYSGATMPALPDLQVVFYMFVDIDSAAPYGEYRFSFVPEGLPSGEAWIYNTYAASDLSHPVVDLRDGILKVGSKPYGGLPLFIRGDVNQDLMVDLADPIYFLGSLFGQLPLPQCIDACDANDSGWADISDAVYTLTYLFVHGKRPPDPHRAPGLDWTPDSLDCENPAAGWLSDFWPKE